MQYPEKKELFEKTHKPGESALLTFTGVDGYDVYNCSIPFESQGETYLYGRVEKRKEWARSHVRLFRRAGQDLYQAVPDSFAYPLEDPYISFIGGQLTMGGTHVVREGGEIARLYAYFYQGSDPRSLDYFTTGPVNMKDIRLVEMKDGIGVFSRPRGPEVLAKYQSESVVGFTAIRKLSELIPSVIESAPVIPNMFAPGEWGGCNQCYPLDSGLIGIIGHKSYGKKADDGLTLAVYVNASFVFDPKSHSVVDEKILATRSSYPAAPCKKPELADCAFTSGIVPRSDGRFDLYSGLGDACEGRTVIDDPFEGFGSPLLP